MRILMASDMFYHQVNGVSNSVLTLTRELIKLGHEVKVLSLSNTRRSYRQGEYYFIGSHDSIIYPSARMSMKRNDPLIDELIAWRPQIAHIQTEFSADYLAMRIVVECRIPVVMNFHTDYETFLKRFILFKKPFHSACGMFYRYIYRYTRRLIIPSEKVRLMLEDYGIDKPTVRIPTGLALPEHHITKEKKAELLKKYGLKSNGKVVVIVSRMSKEKNVGELIDYFPLVRKENPDAGLLIVGGGPALNELRLKATFHGLRNNVAFTGMIDPDDINLFYQLGNVFVCASTFETQGMTYYEAMANGLPQVVRYDTCLDGVIENGVNGFTYETREEFAEYVNRLLSDGDLRRKMSRQALNASKEYSRERFAKKVERVYKDVIKECLDEYRH